MQRHDMLRLDSKGMAFALDSARSRNPRLGEQALRRLFAAGIPAIVCRQERPIQCFVQVGFSAWWQEGGTRFRAGAVVPVACITEIITPFQAVERAAAGSSGTKEAALAALRQEGTAYGLDVGIYGSYALEVLTGYPYTTPESDLDIYVRPSEGRPELEGFFSAAQKIEQAYGVAFDMEAEWGAYGVKLKELLSEQKTVLGKGLYGAELLKRTDLTGAR